MTTVPLPDVPCVRCRMWGTISGVGDWGTRFYLSYSSSAPSGADCIALATELSTAYSAHLVGLASSAVLLSECDVLDIATHSGLSGQYNPSTTGTRAGTPNAAQVAFNVEYGIARRYRGGKPRGYWPFGVNNDLTTWSMWSTSLVTAVNTGIAAFFAAVEASTPGSFTGLQHVLLSYYHGFTNITNSSGRTRAVPTYKGTATHDNVTGYFAKQLLSTQDRRRKATTP